MFDNKMYNIEVLNKPAFSNFMFSNAKEENVVKPPKNPINNKNLILSSNSPFKENKPNRKPISSEPIIFTVNVPDGNDDVFLEAIKSATMKRKTLPTAPPTII